MAKSKSNETEEEEEQISESYISIGLGLLVVVVVGILLYNYFTQKNNKTTQPGQEITEATTSAKPGNVYTVAAGDTLWSISEKAYGTGFNWQEIATANNLANSDQLEAGVQLTIPEVSPKAVAASTSPEASIEATNSPTLAENPQLSASPEITVNPSPVLAPTVGASITGNTYTIVAGDTLWDIACRAYGDCYAWTKIAQENQLTNPDLIFSGNELKLPR